MEMEYTKAEKVYPRYHRGEEKFHKRWEKLHQRQKKLSNLRVAMVLIFLSTGFMLAFQRENLLLWTGFIFSFIGFVAFVLSHETLKEGEQYLKGYQDLYKKQRMRKEGRWREFEQRGTEFIDRDHSFSYDLDIFGQNSIFQWIDDTTSALGKQKLYQLLISPLEKEEAIIRRQNLLEELGKKELWVRRFLVEGRVGRKKQKDFREVIQWGSTLNPTFSKPAVIFAVKALPWVTLLTGLAGIFTELPLGPFVLLLALHGVLFALGFLKRGRVLGMVKDYQLELNQYIRQLKVFEKHRFNSEALQALQQSLKAEGGKSGTEQLKALEKLANRTLNKQNMLFIPINILTLWDYRCLVDLEQWKRESGKALEQWIDTLGEVEALVSLSNIHRDHRDWALPKVAQEPSVYHGKALAHPLISGGAVSNDIVLNPDNPILLITGSNMSGKSTYLRTAGINLLFMNIGTKVCAREMEASLMKIHTCMRISDNIEKNISSFYGEILRIKEIVEETKKGKPVFFLLDEIFKGTNSMDRHLGAKILIQQLYETGGVGLVSTHDLELTELEENPKVGVKNYHFQETYKDGEIQFDYKLRPGASRTTNALYLMEMAGVEVTNRGDPVKNSKENPK
ncbi:MutS family DNA mismatch repair protein [Isachenkonia alkalipeptolytica]|uniref:DNA mismatch repair protein n=1 Tax=Isachenkonia alkalipeptolytica TaxID=2565777 RepID=A0AA44BDL4_9CLOT|nr:MutS family DNA mismatch repair protein [Isachenkonia alkalipeptolytica]NBG88092.1 DNA mismatch repair protein [Isachenkonia alkalipeptolytica]